MIGDELRAQLDALRSPEQVVGLRVDDYTVLIGLVHLLSLKTNQRGLAWGRLGDRYGEIAKADQEISEYLNRMVKVMVDSGQRARLDQERDVRMKTIRNALMGILLFALVALLIGAPAGLISVAQDATPSEEVATLVATEPAPEPTLAVTVVPPVEPAPVIDTTELPDYVYVLVGLGVLAVLILFGGALYALYNSIPSWAQYGVNSAIIEGVRIGKEVAAKTPTQIDDEVMKEIARRVSEIIGTQVSPSLLVTGNALSDELAEAILKYGDRLKPPSTSVDREGGVG